TVLVLRCLLDDGKHAYFLDLECRDSKLIGAFAAMAADVVIRFEHGARDELSVLRTVLAEWRELLRTGDVGMDGNKVVGLFAELHVLGALLDRNPLAEEWWTASAGTPQDFRNTNGAIEVKATLAGDASVIRVHGADQLWAPSDGSLSLGFFRLGRVPGGGVTLPDLVHSLEERVDDRERFQTKLRDAGYHRRHADRYSRVGFELIETRWYEVVDGFPRLGLDAPRGVTGVDYYLDLVAAKDYETAMERAIEGFLP
ncbi:MAG: PD-(D/E)XK motif protein, partial [Verrucomicrobiaceae bacterium]